jgi:hypothetical protein
MWAPAVTEAYRVLWARQVCINAAVCDKEQDVHFIETSYVFHRAPPTPSLMPGTFRVRSSSLPPAQWCGAWRWVFCSYSTVRGIYEFMSPHYLNDFHSDVKKAGAGGVDSLPVIKCQPLAALLAPMPGIRHFNVFFLDVEGGELAILRSVDFSKLSFDVLCVEVRHRCSRGGGAAGRWFCARGAGAAHRRAMFMDLPFQFPRASLPLVPLGGRDPFSAPVGTLEFYARARACVCVRVRVRVRVRVVHWQADGRNLEKDAEVRTLLAANGYKYDRRSHPNDWFVRTGFVASAAPAASIPVDLVNLEGPLVV